MPIDVERGTLEVAFPSTRWFEALGELMQQQKEAFGKIGAIDSVMQVTIVDGTTSDEPWSCQVTFEGFSVVDVQEVGPDELERADFILETDLDTWKEMVDSIVAGAGKPDLDHTLNRLSLPGVPIRLWGVDPVRRDAYYRFNQTLQHYINNCTSLHTVWSKV